jgi:hypothetical protein
MEIWDTLLYGEDVELESFFFARGQICPDFFVSVIYLAGAAGKKRAKKKDGASKKRAKKKYS